MTLSARGLTAKQNINIIRTHTRIVFFDRCQRPAECDVFKKKIAARYFLWRKAIDRCFHTHMEISACRAYKPVLCRASCCGSPFPIRESLPLPQASPLPGMLRVLRPPLSDLWWGFFPARGFFHTIYFCTSYRKIVVVNVRAASFIYTHVRLKYECVVNVCSRYTKTFVTKNAARQTCGSLKRYEALSN